MSSSDNDLTQHQQAAADDAVWFSSAEYVPWITWCDRNRPTAPDPQLLALCCAHLNKIEQTLQEIKAVLSPIITITPQ